MTFLQTLPPGSSGMLWGILGIVAFFVLIGFLKSLIRVTFPDQLLVVTGRKKVKDWKTFGFSVERGRTALVPYFQSVNKLDLRVFPINVRVEGVNSANGITLGADATACVCIDDDDESMLYSAVERLMGKDYEQIHDQISQTLIGNFRGALNKATPIEAIGMQSYTDIDEIEDNIKESTDGERAQFRNALLEDINSDLSSFGMQVVSVSLQKIWDTSNYIANLAQKTLATKRREVEVEEAGLRARADQAESDADRRIEIAKNKADEQILAAREALEVYRRESDALISKARLEADSKIDGAVNQGQKEVETRMVNVKTLQNQSQVIIKEKANRHAAQLIAEGEEGAVKIVENAKNKILEQKVALLAESQEMGNVVLFIQQQLPHLFEAYRKNADGFKVDSLIIMDDEKGFNGAVNRGPDAFGNFLTHFENAMGISIKEFLNTKKREA